MPMAPLRASTGDDHGPERVQPAQKKQGVLAAFLTKVEILERWARESMPDGAEVPTTLTALRQWRGPDGDLRTWSDPMIDRPEVGRHPDLTRRYEAAKRNIELRINSSNSNRVKKLEINIAVARSDNEFSGFKTPRLSHASMPYSAVPKPWRISYGRIASRCRRHDAFSNSAPAVDRCPAVGPLRRARPSRPDRAAKIPSAVRTVSGDGLINLIGFLKAQNAKGFNIIGRPADPRYIFIDDLSNATICAMVNAGHRPAVVAQFSPANYQGFFDVGVGIDHTTAKLLARYLAACWGGDPGSADAWHAGRLPSFTNRKPKHRRPDGSYPFAILRTASLRTDPILAGMVRSPSNSTAEAG